MKRYGLIGYPLAHSFSQSFFEAKFLAEKITDARFDLLPMSDLTELPALLSENDEWKGFAVTIPHKKNIIPYLHELDETAHQIGAVNCIRIRAGHSIGFNTDVVGFERTLQYAQVGNDSQALILGNGGASACVQYALKKRGIAYQLVGRKQPSVDTKIDLLYSALAESHIRQHALIINTTPVGMYPHDDTCPAIPYAHISGAHTLIDLVYNPAETLFMQKGKERGAQVINGSMMFEQQAEENWRIWNS